MTTEPKIFTHADLEWLERETDPRDIIRILRERGLIAEEPVDPLLVEAREIAIAHANWNEKQWREPCLRGDMDANPFTVAVLAALRRGMELAPRKELTREMVERAVDRATDDCKDSRWDDNFAKLLHAALTEALQ